MGNPTDFECQMAILAVCWVICFGYLAISMCDPRGTYYWSSLLSVPVRIVVFVLSPLTLLTYIAVWAISGGKLGPWLYTKLQARYYRRHPVCPAPSSESMRCY